MDIGELVKSTQEQGVASWIHQLNQERLDELLARLSSQDSNLEKALDELKILKGEAAELIARNRGGEKGLHGFLAETAEAHIENARNLIRGLSKSCEWVNDNGPADLLRDGTPIQQKFVESNGHFGLEKIKEHFQSYRFHPDFKGGKYQIPKNFYNDLQSLLTLSEEDAAKGPTETYRLWKWVHEFFAESGIDPQDIEPSLLDYEDVQVGKVGDTIRAEENAVRATDQSRRDAAYEDSKANLRQGAQAAAGAAMVEGGVRFCLSVAKKLKSGKRLHEFTAEDWKDVGVDTAKGAGTGGIRGAAVYAMTNFTATPAAVANAFVTAAYGVTAQAVQLRRGQITEEEFVVNSEVLCLDVSVSAVAALMGQVMIPVPVLGAMIGNAVGMFLWQISKDYLNQKEQRLASAFKESCEELNRRLDARYQALLAELAREFEKYSSLLELAFDPDVNIAFANSVLFAQYAGVADDRILKTSADIDHYFMS